jgi:hypothetical protein
MVLGSDVKGGRPVVRSAGTEDVQQEGHGGHASYQSSLSHAYRHPVNCAPPLLHMYGNPQTSLERYRWRRACDARTGSLSGRLERRRVRIGEEQRDQGYLDRLVNVANDRVLRSHEEKEDDRQRCEGYQGPSRSAPEACQLRDR